MASYYDIQELIIRLFAGETNPEEKKIVSEWLSQSAENKKLFHDLREIWLSAGIPNNSDHYNLEAAIINFRSQVRSKKQLRTSTVRLFPYFKYVAIFIIALALPFSFYLGTRSNLQNSTTTISCAYGDKSRIVLPDSSIVWLNSGSKITFNSDFANAGRFVSLDGEAFFAVTKDKSHPFKVKTSDLEIQVLGTRFNVKAYAGDQTISTTLVEGSVQVSGKFRKTVIQPDQKLVFNKETKKLNLVKLADTAPETEWKEGRLIFRNESLEELKPKLERWFDVDIVLSDEQVKNRRFTGVLMRESILEVVSYFDLSSLVVCRIEGNKIIIKSENK